MPGSRVRVPLLLWMDQYGVRSRQRVRVREPRERFATMRVDRPLSGRPSRWHRQLVQPGRGSSGFVDRDARPVESFVGSTTDAKATPLSCGCSGAGKWHRAHALRLLAWLKRRNQRSSRFASVPLVRCGRRGVVLRGTRNLGGEVGRGPSPVGACGSSEAPPRSGSSSLHRRCHHNRTFSGAPGAGPRTISSLTRRRPMRCSRVDWWVCANDFTTGEARRAHPSRADFAFVRFACGHMKSLRRQQAC